MFVSPTKWVPMNSGGAITSIVLKGSEDGEIEAEVDPITKKATITLEELEFQELHANELWVGGKNIFDYIPNLKNVNSTNLKELNLANGTTLAEVSSKLNEVIGRLNNIAGNQSFTA